jgi:hypothetical protein
MPEQRSCREHSVLNVYSPVIRMGAILLDIRSVKLPVPSGHGASFRTMMGQLFTDFSLGL